MNLIKKRLRVLIAYNEPEKRATTGDLDYISEAAVKNEADIVYHSVSKLGHVTDYLPVKNLEGVLRKVEAFKPNLIFNLCEGYRGNAKHEMYLAGLWELMGIPYTGNPPMTLGLAQNKILAKELFEVNKISTPSYQVYTQSPENICLDYPLIAKPASEDASLGITQHSVIYNFNELQITVKELLKKYKQPILVEKYIPGREFNISILGNNPPKVLPISEINFSELNETTPHITSYEAKWLPEHPLYQKTPAVCPAPTSSKLKQQLEEVALQVYSVLMGRDYGRVDTRVDANENIYVLEFNPNPDISADAGYARALKAAGIPYTDFIELLIDQTMSRMS